MSLTIQDSLLYILRKTSKGVWEMLFIWLPAFKELYKRLLSRTITWCDHVGQVCHSVGIWSLEFGSWLWPKLSDSVSCEEEQLLGWCWPLCYKNKRITMQRKCFFRFIQGVKDCNLTHSNYVNIHYFFSSWFATDICLWKSFNFVYLRVGLLKLMNLIKISWRLDKRAFCAYCLQIGTGHFWSWGSNIVLIAVSSYYFWLIILWWGNRNLTFCWIPRTYVFKE